LTRTTPRQLARQLGHVPPLAVLAVFVGCSAPVPVDTLPAGQPVSRSAATTPAAALSTSSRNAVLAADADASPAGETVTIARVIDGDTFELVDGRTVRPLGIDSCEMDTPGSPEAKSAAEDRLTGSFNANITITAEPGIDLDRHGRTLRYVQLNTGRDFGEEMVKYDHTGIYDPANNDASRAYLDRLYAADLVHAANPPSGQDYGDPAPAVAPAPPAAEPEPEPAAAPAPAASNCHSSYEPCIPDGADLDCSDLSHSVRVVGPDEYRLDRDKDGVGCESTGGTPWTVWIPHHRAAQSPSRRRTLGPPVVRRGAIQRYSAAILSAPNARRPRRNTLERICDHPAPRHRTEDRAHDRRTSDWMVAAWSSISSSAALLSLAAVTSYGAYDLRNSWATGNEFLVSFPGSPGRVRIRARLPPGPVNAIYVADENLNCAVRQLAARNSN
jgi:endonuclease YncB( thermonuclease family)